MRWLIGPSSWLSQWFDSIGDDVMAPIGCSLNFSESVSLCSNVQYYVVAYTVRKVLADFAVCD